MNPCNLRISNSSFGPPEGMDESQVFRIPAYVGTIEQGNLDGSNFVVVAWKPEPKDLIRLMAGGAIYLSCLGGLPPHFLTTSFAEATYGKEQD